MTAVLDRPDTGGWDDGRLDDLVLDSAETAPLAVVVGLGLTETGLAETGPAGVGLADAGLASQGSAGATRASHARPRHRRGPLAAGSAAAELAGGRTGALPVATRFLVTTPWFAAATGFVIAVSLLIYAPHTRFGIPDLAIGKVQCSQINCGSDTNPQTAPTLAIASGQPIPQGQRANKQAAASKVRAGGRTRTAASGLKFGYFVHPLPDGRFSVIITVSGEHAIRNWRLSFALPGDRILSVTGADWKRRGRDRGTARPSTSKQPGVTGGTNGGAGGPGAQAANDPSAHPSGADAPVVWFEVQASGRTPVLADCRFDGVACAFYQLTSSWQG